MKNKAEGYIASIDRGLEEQKDKIDAKQKEETEKLRDELKKAVETEDYATLKEKIGQLEQAAAMMSQYANQQSAAQGSATSNGSNPDDVVDVDYSEKN